MSSIDGFMEVGEHEGTDSPVDCMFLSDSKAEDLQNL